MTPGADVLSELSPPVVLAPSGTPVKLNGVIVDLGTLPSEVLRHLFVVAEAREVIARQDHEQRIARAADLLTRPTIGAIRRRAAQA